MKTYQARIKGISYFQVRADGDFGARKAIIIGLIRIGAPGLLKRWLLSGAELREVVDLKKWIEEHFDREELRGQIDIGDDTSIVVF